MATDETVDALIIGARVAGSVLAARLGDAGARVLLVDRATFPSPTLSTHFFRGGQTLTVMQELGVLDDLLSTGAPKLDCQYFYLNGSDTPSVDLPQDPGDIGYALSVRRVTLDNILVRRATAAPEVKLLERTRFAELLWDDGRVVGARLITPEGERSVKAGIVVGADGRHSLVAHAVEPKGEETSPAYRALYYVYVRGFSGPDGGPQNGPEFSLLDDEFAYVFPSDAGITCIAVSIGRKVFTVFRHDVDTGLREHISRHRGIAERFQTAAWEGRVLGFPPEPSWVRVPCGPGWALVGDAGLHQDPWSGQGIDCASRHASFLADALLDWFSGRAAEADALATFHTRRNEHGLPRYHETQQFAPDLRTMTE